MERRNSQRKDWVIGKDDVGRSVLEWKVDYRATKRRESDPSARTYDFLQSLDSPELSLADDYRPSTRGTGLNPYDTGTHRLKVDRR